MPRGVYQRKTAAKPDGEAAEALEELADGDATYSGADETAVADASVDDAQSAVDGDGGADAADAGSDYDTATPQAAEPTICPECFPNGWPDGVTSAGCIHGQWERAEDGS